jgi:hypothetical protein
MKKGQVKSDGDRWELPPDIPCTAVTWHGRKPGMITICETVLSGAAPARIREQTEGLASGWLPDLAVKLAGDPALTVSVITHEDSTQELEVLRTGPPHHTEQTIDSGRFTRQPGQTLPIAEAPGVQNAVAVVRAILLDDSAP